MQRFAGSGVKHTVKCHSLSVAYSGLFNVWPWAAGARVLQVWSMGALRISCKKKKKKSTGYSKFLILPRSLLFFFFHFFFFFKPDSQTLSNGEGHSSLLTALAPPAVSRRFILHKSRTPGQKLVQRFERHPILSFDDSTVIIGERSVGKDSVYYGCGKYIYEHHSFIHSLLFSFNFFFPFPSSFAYPVEIQYIKYTESMAQSDYSLAVLCKNQFWNGNDINISYGPTETSSGNRQETETRLVRPCHALRQPRQNHHVGHLGGWVTQRSAEKMLDRQC